MKLLPSHFADIEEIALLLELSGDCTIAFARCNEPVLREAIYEEILKRVDDTIYIYRLEMNEESTNLFQLLNEILESDLYKSKIKENIKVAFFISGLDSALKMKNKSGKSQALLLMNMMREKFLEYRHFILIWLNTASLDLVLREAPDFFSWRTGLFEFDTDNKIRPRPVFGFEDFFREDRKGLERLISYYSGKMRDFKEKGIKDPYKFAYWNYQLGTIHILLGQAEKALKYLESARAIIEKTSGVSGKNLKQSIYCKLGIVSYRPNAPKKAVDFLEKALNISQEMGDWRGKGNILGNLAMIYGQTGEHYNIKKAIEFYERALGISRETGDKHCEEIQLGNLGCTYSDMGDPGKAIEFYNQALEISGEIGDLRGEGIQLGNLGVAYHQLGEIERAIEFYNRSLKISGEVGDSPGEGIQLGKLGAAHRDMGNPKKALEFFKKALDIGKIIKELELIRFCEENIRKLEGSAADL